MNIMAWKKKIVFKVSDELSEAWNNYRKLHPTFNASKEFRKTMIRIIRDGELELLA